MERVRAAVIGVGIGRLHIEGYRNCGAADVVALCDLDSAKAKATAEEFGIPNVFTDVGEMLESVELDAVSVCTPNATHAELAVAAMEKGIAVLCEKPMADTLANARRVAEAVGRTGAPFMMGYNNRYRSESRYIRDKVAAGDFGRVYYARCGWVRRHGIPGMGGWFTRKEMAGGGPMMDIGVHALDLTMFLLGFPEPVSVCGASYAEFGPRGRGIGPWSQPTGSDVFTVEDLAAGMVRFDNGLTLMVEASWAQFIGQDSLYASVYGTEGGADVEPFVIHVDGPDGKPADYTPELPQANGHHAEVAHFVECLRSGVKPDGGPEQGLAVMRIIDGLYRSAAEGREVTV